MWLEQPQLLWLRVVFGIFAGLKRKEKRRKRAGIKQISWNHHHYAL